MFGTLTTLDRYANENATVAAFGLDNLMPDVANALAAYNAAMNSAVQDFAILTSDPLVPFGGDTAMVMQELDEFGSPDTQKIAAGQNMGVPLRHYGIAVQWSERFQRTRTVADLTKQFDAAATADRKLIINQIFKALTKPTPGTEIDALTNLQLTINPLYNGTMTPPPSPTGTTFDASHKHFSASTALVAADLDALINTVIEHGGTGTLKVFISRADQAMVEGLAKFVKYTPANIVMPTTEVTALGTLDTENPDDRAIGLYDGIEVWVKPWVPQHYQIVSRTGANATKPLAIRTTSGTLAGDAYAGGFGLFYEDALYPLRARAMGRDFGVAVVNPGAAAVHFSNGSTYTMPVVK